MNTKKVVKKLNDLGFFTSILIEKQEKVTAVIESQLNDVKLKNIVKAFTSEKYNSEIKIKEGKLVIEITENYIRRYTATVRMPDPIFPFHLPPIRCNHH
ncbi:hypothetical protein [Chryseobacterium sp. KCF3-3]|uniref:hypothetical protein n=1 Tax=Chryseobacterium sp. KCF3-3 TaxID=3231511 RepID=UPI0038B37333